MSYGPLVQMLSAHKNMGIYPPTSEIKENSKTEDTL